jgi:hypothetical protein
MEHHCEGISYRAIAEIMGVKSHRTIMFIVNPKTLEKNMNDRKKREARNPEKYKKKTKERRNEDMTKHRKHKKDLIDKLDLTLKPQKRY